MIISFKHKARLLFSNNLFRNTPPEAVLGMSDVFQELYKGTLYPETSVVLHHIDIEPDRVKPHTLHFFGRRLSHLYGWFMSDHGDSQHIRFSFNSTLSSLLRFRPLSSLEKRELLLLATYYQDNCLSLLDYDDLVYLQERDIYFDNIALPGKRQMNMLNYLSDLACVVKNSLPMTLSHIERMTERSIVNNDNADDFYIRLLQENDGTTSSVHDFLMRWSPDEQEKLKRKDN